MLDFKEAIEYELFTTRFFPFPNFMRPIFTKLVMRRVKKNWRKYSYWKSQHEKIILQKKATEKTA